MKKKILFLVMLSLVFLLGGCGKKGEDDIIKDLTKKINDSKAYYIEGDLEIVNNEDVYTYDVKVSYAKDDNYKVDLTNTVNNHQQIILRNKEGVYVVTPRINKSFKFQSDWPYNNSQVYLLKPLLDDMTNDENRVFSEEKDGYKFTVSANYPNNQKLVKEEILLDKNLNFKKVTVLDTDGKAQITMNFKKVDLNSKFNDNYFELKENINVANEERKEDNVPKEEVKDNTNANTNTNTNTNENTNTTENEDETKTNNNVNTNENTNTNTNANENNNTNDNTNTTEESKKTKETSSIEDIIYPMYIPTNTYLTNKEKVNKDNGERLILTFEGDSPFMLIEETAVVEDEHLIVPTFGDLELMASTVAIVNDNSVSWIDNDVEYYVVSDKLSKIELLNIARSMSALPVSK